MFLCLASEAREERIKRSFVGILFYFSRIGAKYVVRVRLMQGIVGLFKAYLRFVSIRFLYFTILYGLRKFWINIFRENFTCTNPYYTLASTSRKYRSINVSVFTVTSNKSSIARIFRIFDNKNASLNLTHIKQKTYMAKRNHFFFANNANVFS